MVVFLPSVTRDVNIWRRENTLGRLRSSKLGPIRPSMPAMTQMLKDGIGVSRAQAIREVVSALPEPSSAGIDGSLISAEFAVGGRFSVGRLGQ